MAKLLALPSLLLLLLGFLLHFPRDTKGANVLAVLPSVWKSHYLFGRRLLQQLVASEQQNHSVTLISPYASSSGSVEEAHDEASAPAIREIQIAGLHENWIEMGLSFDVEQMRQISVMERFTRLIYAGTTNVDLLLADVQVRKLMRSGENFDLLVLDLFLSDSLLGLAHYYQIPTVVVSPTGANTWLNQMLGNPQSSALDPSNFLDYSERMSIWERSVNTLMAVFEKLTYNFFHMIAQQSVYAKHFQPLLANATSAAILPHHRELTQNLSLVLLNSHPVVQYPRAYLPNMLEIAGAHLHQALELKLPNHLKEFIEAAPAGVVYMSLGANVRTIDLAREKLDAIFDVFAYLKEMHFVLKWELTEIDANLPKNVLMNDWLPQEAILAHPNVKVFISACGLMSIVESINGLTPLLAIPIYPEQEVAARRLQKQGAALTLSFDAITYDGLLHSVQQLATNATYAQNVLQLRNALNSNYGTPAAKSLHYIEMILSSGGGTFLQSHAHHLNFLRTELVDVLAIILAGLLVIIAVPFVVTCCILKRSYYSQAQQQEAAVAAASYRVTLNVVGRMNSVGAGVHVSGAGAGGGDGEPVRRRRASTSLSTSSTSTSSSSVGGSPIACGTPQKPRRGW